VKLSGNVNMNPNYERQNLRAGKKVPGKCNRN